MPAKYTETEIIILQNWVVDVAWKQPSIITITHLFKYIENFTTKNWKFPDNRNSDIFPIAAQNIDCGYLLEPPRRGGSNEYPQSMILSRNEKNVYPCKPQFYCINGV